jgi:hypothetical protein
MVFLENAWNSSAPGLFRRPYSFRKIDNDLRAFDEIAHNPIGAAVGRVAIKACLNTDGSNPGIAAAVNIDFFVANKKRAGKIDSVFSRCLKDHSR